MMGFLTSVVEEFITGKGTLRQIGFETPSTPLFAFLLVFFGGLTAFASARTLYKATNKQLTATCVPFAYLVHEACCAFSPLHVQFCQLQLSCSTALNARCGIASA